MSDKHKYEVFDYKDNFDKLLKIICILWIVMWIIDGLKFLPG
jgi:hypothetical protein